MSVTDGVVAPQALVIPSGAFAGTITDMSPGAITLSGGLLIFMSGTTLYYINAAAL